MKTSPEYTFSTLKDKPELFDQVLRVVESSFNYPSSQQFAVDFYPLVNPSNFANNHIIICNKTKEVVGHIGLTLRQLGNNTHSMPVAFIGGIAIDTLHRGIGLYKDLMQKVITMYQNDICLFFLWSDLQDLYSKFKFFPAGGQLQTAQATFNEELFIKQYGFKKVSLNSLSESDFRQLKSIYEKSTLKRYTTVLRSFDDWQILVKIHSTSLYIKKDNNQNIVGYFFVGKGHDLENVIHEFGASAAFKDEFYRQLVPYKLWVPDQELDYVNGLGQKLDDLQIMSMALIRIASVERFNNYLEKIGNGVLKINALDDLMVTFIHKDIEYKVSMADFLQYILGPNKLLDFKEYGLPLYLSGLDSI
ncbi:MAG: GNAT family N-acetyltransferase [Bacteriovoracaceae bacterium]|nr:GNAT family N-acetyltransferase [Bacteriovoracaceae bacterium]